MGCFLGCFGSSKDQKSSKERNMVLHRDHGSRSYQLMPASVPRNQNQTEKPMQAKPEGSLSHIVGKHRESNMEEPNQLNSCSGAKLFRPNERYQNCRYSSDEDEGGEESDLDQDVAEDYESGSVVLESQDVMAEICSLNREINRLVRDRSAFVHPVLNPIENLSQWKTAKETSKQHQEPTTYEESYFSFGTRTDPSEEASPEASLSSWLGSSESVPAASKNRDSSSVSNRGSTVSDAMSGSNSGISFEDRPILGTLTLKEIKKSSISSTPRHSPTWRSRSPDDAPTIGTVRGYWGHQAEEAGKSYVGSFAASYKGTPNTTSKYREDKRVQWHSTPFETRLERALNRGALVRDQ